MSASYYYRLGCLAVVLACAPLAALCCPDATNWYKSPTTGHCYRALFDQKLTLAEAQKKCNDLRSNLMQFVKSTTDAQFEAVLTELYRNSTAFQGQSWIGLTDRQKQMQYTFLNGVSLASMKPNILVGCPNSPNSETACKPANRCVYLHLRNRGTSQRQIFAGDCSQKLDAICYSPDGGTSSFDKIPDKAAGSVGASVLLLLLMSSVAAAVAV